MAYDFYMPARVLGGEGIVLAQSALMRKFGTKCVVVTGGSGAKKSGALADAVVALEKEKIEYKIYDKIGENPLVESCREAGLMAADFGADFLVGIGGGSALDAVKAAAVFAANPSLEAEEVYRMQYKFDPLPTVGIGTTSGTGSEISAVSVLTDTKGVKRSIKGDFGYFNLVFADWRYTCSCPMSVTVSTALDAFMHAAEGWLGPKCNEAASAFAAECLPKIYGYLKKFLADGELPDDEGRRVLYHASLSAGFTLNYCGTLFPHPVGYILTEHYGIPHGRACAAFFEPLLKKVRCFAPEKADSLVRLLGDSEENIIHTMKTLADCSHIVIDEDRAAELVKRWGNVPKNFEATPGGFTHAEAAQALVNLSK